MKATLAILLLLLAACNSNTPPASPTAQTTPEETHVESVTKWSTHTELFVEFPTLVQGRNSRFAIHLTRLDSFRPVLKGTAEVILAFDASPGATFASQSPSRPGIFGVDVKPSRSGKARLLIRYRGESIEDSHDLGTVDVHATPPPPHAEEESETSEVSFLKEQQWVLDFATATAEKRTLASSIRVPAEVEPRPGAWADVAAPFDGRLRMDRLPALGSTVREGQTLAYVVLPANNPTDTTGPQLALQEAETMLALATKDAQRARRLTEGGAAPVRRLEEAETTLALARARLAAARERIRVWNDNRDASGDAQSRSFAIKAPLSGIIERVLCAPGQAIKAGDNLFYITDPDRVLVAGIVPESEYPRIRALSGAELEIPGQPSPRRLNRLLRVGSVVDSATRTFPISYEFDNRERLIAINQTVHLRFFFGSAPPGPAIPESAIVDDNGSPVVYVQASGESFIRRPVRLGDRSAGMVAVLSGLSAGERVVVRGAHLIRLASLSGQAPAHGHVH